MIRQWRGQSKQRVSKQMGGPPAAPEKAFADFLQYRRVCGLIARTSPSNNVLNGSFEFMRTRRADAIHRRMGGILNRTTGTTSPFANARAVGRSHCLPLSGVF